MGLGVGRFVLQNVRRRPGRNLAIFFCFAFIAANIFTSQYLMTGTAVGLDLGVERLGADLLVVPAQYALITTTDPKAPLSAGLIVRVEPTLVRMNRSVMDRIGKVPDVAAFSPQVYVGSPSMPGQPGTVDVYGIDPVTDFTVRPWLVRPLPCGLGPGQAIAGSAIGGDQEQITLYGSPYAIVGRLAPTRSGVDRSVFVTLDDAYALAATPGAFPPTSPPPGQDEVSAVLVRAATGADAELVGARIQQPFSLAYLRVLSRHFAIRSASGAAQGLPAVISLVSLVVIAAAIPLIALIAAMVSHERRHEIGLLMAMGAKRRFVFSVTLAESLVLAGTGGIAGAASGLLAAFLLDSGGALAGTFGQGFRSPSLPATGGMIAVSLAAVILIGTFATLWPAYRSCRMNPYDAIRSGM